MHKKIVNLNKLPYEIILKKNEDKFILFINELSCVVEDSNLLVAYEKLEIKKHEILTDMISLGLEDEIKRPASFSLNAVANNPLPIFLAKAIVACGVTLFIAFAIIYVVHDSVRQMVPGGPLGLIRNQIAQVKHGLEQMNPNDKKELLDKIHQTVLEIKPFTNELRILFQDAAPICGR